MLPSRKNLLRSRSKTESLIPSLEQMDNTFKTAVSERALSNMTELEMTAKSYGLPGPKWVLPNKSSSSLSSPSPTQSLTPLPSLTLKSTPKPEPNPTPKPTPKPIPTPKQIPKKPSKQKPQPSPSPSPTPTPSPSPTPQPHPKYIPNPNLNPEPVLYLKKRPQIPLKSSFIATGSLTVMIYFIVQSNTTTNQKSSNNSKNQLSTTTKKSTTQSSSQCNLDLNCFINCISYELNGTSFKNSSFNLFSDYTKSVEYKAANDSITLNTIVVYQKYYNNLFLDSLSISSCYSVCNIDTLNSGNLKKTNLIILFSLKLIFILIYFDIANKFNY